MTALLYGSSREDGNTYKIAQEYKKHHVVDVFSLGTYHITEYDYLHRNEQDDFLKLIDVLMQYDTWILASPIYWYSMSAKMKIFLDRTSDLITIRKELGRKLENKNMAALSCGDGPKVWESFFPPFKLTAQYFKMNYFGDFHAFANEKEIILPALSFLKER